MKMAVRIVDDDDKVLVELGSCEFRNYDEGLRFLEQIFRSGYDVYIKRLDDFKIGLLTHGTQRKKRNLGKTLQEN